MDFYHAPDPVHQTHPISVLASLRSGPALGLQSLPTIDVILEGPTSVAKNLRPFRTPIPQHFIGLVDANVNPIPHVYNTVKPTEQYPAVISALDVFTPISSHDALDSLFAAIKQHPSSLDDTVAICSTTTAPTISSYMLADIESTFTEWRPQTWKLTIIGLALAVFLLEVYINTRQWRLRTKTTAAESHPRHQKDTVKGRVAYNITHSLVSFVRTSLIIWFNLGPWVWYSVSQLLLAFPPATLIHMGDAWHSLFFFAACWLGYLVLHSLDAALHFCFIGESWLSYLAEGWALPQMRRDVQNARPLYAVLAFGFLLTLLTKPFFAQISLAFLPAAIAFQLLYAILSYVLSRPRKSALSLMQDEVLVEAITELATTAKFPLKNIYISSDSVFDEDLEEQGVMVYGLLKKHSIIINKRMLADFTSEDIMALLARTLGSWRSMDSYKRSYSAQLQMIASLCLLAVFVDSIGIYTKFGFPIMRQKCPSTAALVMFAIVLARPFHLYHSAISNHAGRAMAFQADKYAASLGYSYELSSVLAKISALTAKAGALEQDQEHEQEHVDDRAYAILYHPQSSPQISQRLTWLEEEHVKEAMKDGCIRLPLSNEKS